MSLSINKPQVAVTSASTFWKSSEAVESLEAGARFFELKEQQSDKVEIGAVSFHEGLASEMTRRLARLPKLLPPILLATGAIAASVASFGLLSVPLALGLAGASALGLSATAVFARVEKELGPSAVPRGLSLSHTGFEKLEFPDLHTNSPAEGGLASMALANMKHYPQSLQVLHLNGHGHGAKAIAGLPGEQAREALVEAVQESQRKFDIVFYETCYGANVEFLLGQSEVADYALAFEDMIPKSNSKRGRLPLESILTQAVNASNPREAAVNMAQVASKHFDSEQVATISAVPFAERSDKSNRIPLWENPDSTAIAVDLVSLKSKLDPAMNKLGRAFLSQVGNQSDFKEVLNDAKEKNLLEPTGDLIDLGGFLRSVQTASPANEGLQAALAETLESLDESLLYKRTGDTLPLSGLSFHSKPNKVSSFSNPVSEAHANPGLPGAWVEFVEQVWA